MSGVTIRRVRYDSMVAQALVAAALADLGQRYGGDGDETPVDPAQFTPPHGDFFVAYRASEPVGCGGWRSHGADGTVAELKRMYTASAVRGQGVARQLLAVVEQSARDHGRVRIILETGQRQPEAIGLYTSSGYQPIPHFGYYRDDPEVVSLGRDL